MEDKNNKTQGQNGRDVEKRENVNPQRRDVDIPRQHPIPTPQPADKNAHPLSGGKDIGVPQGKRAIETAPRLTEAEKHWEADEVREELELKKSEAGKSEFQRKLWQPILHPIIALCAICLVTSFLLGLTNQVTKPLIEENTAVAAQEARVALLPEADAFEAMDIPADAENITSFYKAANGTGYVIEAFAQGYGGKVPVMVAYDPEGNIAGVTFLANSETPGLGSKLVTDESFSSQFVGHDPTSVGLSDIDAIASATISTNAGLTAINAATNLLRTEVLDLGVDTSSGASEKPEEGGEEGTA